MDIFSKALFLLLSLILSCVDPLNVNIDKSISILVVEGSISTLLGPYSITLSKTAKYGGIFVGVIRPVTNAKVLIRDSSGLTEGLFEDLIDHGPGTYWTSPEFQPIVGESYTLLITTSDGEEYTSLPEKIIKVPEILGLVAEFVTVPTNEIEDTSGLNVLVSFEDNLEEQNFYLWKNNGTYNFITRPYFYVPPPGTPVGEIPVYQPKDCCAECWLHEVGDRKLRIFSDININGSRTSHIGAFIEDNKWRFHEKYLVRIEQHSLSREAFQFFSLFNTQLEIDGDVFDPPPATIRGNMINLTNPDNNVIGYFLASDVSLDSLFLTRAMLLEPREVERINDDCRLFRRGVAIEPPYW